MKKIYVVMEYEYDSGKVIRAFRTRQEAMDRCKWHVRNDFENAIELEMGYKVGNISYCVEEVVLEGKLKHE